MSKHIIKPLDDLLAEDFFNPFDLKDLDKKPDSKAMSDRGGILKLRREVFNINRVQYSKKENGQYTVLAKTQFARGEIIEIAPIIFVGPEVKAIKSLKDYVFEIDKEKQIFGLVMGYGSLYSHSTNPNVEFAYNRSNKQMYFLAKKPIQVEEELSIDYGSSYWEERQNFNTTGQAKPVEENVQPNAVNITGGGSTEEGGNTGQAAMTFNASPDNQNMGVNTSTTGVAVPGSGQQ
jgi:uncharacterized protein